MSLWPTNLPLGDLSVEDKFTILNLRSWYQSGLQQPKHMAPQPPAYMGPDESVRVHMKTIGDKLELLTKEN